VKIGTEMQLWKPYIFGVGRPQEAGSASTWLMTTALRACRTSPTDRLDLELAARQQAEGDIVEHLAGDPAVLSRGS
jgi:hypothetical protein